jgi:hypothetical protein
MRGWTKWRKRNNETTWVWCGRYALIWSDSLSRCAGHLCTHFTSNTQHFYNNPVDYAYDNTVKIIRHCTVRFTTRTLCENNDDVASVPLETRMPFVQRHDAWWCGLKFPFLNSIVVVWLDSIQQPSNIFLTSSTHITSTSTVRAFFKYCVISLTSLTLRY